MKKILPAFIGVQSGDAITTYIGLTQNLAEEANTLALALFSSPLIMMFAKLFGGALLFFLVSRLNNLKKRAITINVITFCYGAVVLNNLLVITGVI